MSRKMKCDYCGARGLDYKVTGTPKKKTSPEELARMGTRLGDNKPVQKAWCGRCRKDESRWK
jgi:hypothetical protein